MRGLSLVAASGGHSSSRCAGLSLSRPLLLRSIGSRRAGSVIVAHGPSCSAACGIFPDQGSNPYPLHWQADSQPLRHQRSPDITYFNKITIFKIKYLVERDCFTPFVNLFNVWILISAFAFNLMCCIVLTAVHEVTKDHLRGFRFCITTTA